MDIRTKRNLTAVNEYIAKLYPPERKGTGVSRPSAEVTKAGIAYLALITDIKQARALTECLMGKDWCKQSGRFGHWHAEGKKLLIRHAVDALPNKTAYNLIKKLKTSRAGKI